MLLTSVSLLLSALVIITRASPASVQQQDSRNVSQAEFDSLEELARLVDISYCVGSTGIQKPFRCLSRCADFEGFELVTTWNTGPLLSDSCGYIALSHPPHPKRVVVAFRGTYSIASTVADLSTNPAEYLPFPADDDDGTICASGPSPSKQTRPLPQLLIKHDRRSSDPAPACQNCTVHAGFLRSWRNTRCVIIPHVEEALAQYPEYELVLVGHSLGGAVAALASLEFLARGQTPHVTTFGEPRVGNRGLNQYIDQHFPANSISPYVPTYRRVTHADDPIPLLPLEEWGYRMHAGEIFISKRPLRPSREDLQHCEGDEDPACIASGGVSDLDTAEILAVDEELYNQGMWTVPSRYKMWELFFAHRDYFWRLGLCMPHGDPWDWSRGKYSHDGDDYERYEL